MNMNRFRDWKIDGYKAISPDNKYCLWIANGFLFLGDHDAHYPRQTLLNGIGIWQRYKIWRELCAERKYRAKKFLSPTSKN